MIEKDQEETTNEKLENEIYIIGNRLKFQILINETFNTEKNQEKIYSLADYLHRLENIFLLRKKYEMLFIALPDKVLFFDNVNEWFEWEKVLLLLFTNFPYATNREYIWKHDIKKANLRNIIKDKSEFIETLDDKILLTDRGLMYILNKLETENNNLIP